MRGYLASRLGQTVLVAKIAEAAIIVDPKRRLEAWADIQQMVPDEVPWVFLWQQHDLYGVAGWIEWTPRADEKVWMYQAKVVPREVIHRGALPPPSHLGAGAWIRDRHHPRGGEPPDLRGRQAQLS